MKSTIVVLLRCPLCKAPLSLSSTRAEQAEIREGQLSCTGCSAEFPISDGVPRVAPPEHCQSHVSQSFGFEWKMHHAGGFEKGTVFGRGIDDQVNYFFEAFGISERDLQGKRILDGGCGSGVLTAEIARRCPGAEVVGMDINPAIADAYRANGQLPNLHLVQASVLAPPFPPESFDLVWCNGVIHHTGNTRGAFDSLTSLVRRDGRAYFWVYEKKASPMVALRMILRPLGLVHWNHRFLYHFCQVIASVTWLTLFLLSPLRRCRFTQNRTHLKILLLQRSYRELVLTWFDVLSPMYRDTFTESEFESWFRDRGFDHLSRYWWPVGISGVKKAASS